MDRIIIETRDLCKTFRGQNAVQKVNLMIPENSIYGLLGANGAGKSTTLKLLTGMLRPTSGEILYKGKNFSRNDLSEIGALIESPPIYEKLTARENLKVRTLALGLPEQRIEEVLAVTDLKDTGNKRAGRFSMGMKQRQGYFCLFHLQAFVRPIMMKNTWNRIQNAWNRKRLLHP